MFRDSTTLRSYVTKSMIPRGLRLKKAPTAKYTEEFTNKWNAILSDCSLKLMRLIIEQEELILKDIAEEIQITVTSLTPFEGNGDLAGLKAAMESNLLKLEDMITETKKSKFSRDNNDYKQNQVYTWKVNPYQSRQPRSILKRDQYKSSWKNRTSSPRVSFSERSYDSASRNTVDEFSDISGDYTREGNRRQEYYGPPHRHQSPYATRYNTNNPKSAPPPKNGGTHDPDVTMRGRGRGKKK